MTQRNEVVPYPSDSMMPEDFLANEFSFRKNYHLKASKMNALEQKFKAIK